MNGVNEPLPVIRVPGIEEKQKISIAKRIVTIQDVILCFSNQLIIE